MARSPTPRAQAAALLLPLLGVFVLLPPFVTLFVGPWRPVGIPLIVLYLFSVWAVLVLAAWRLSARLGDTAEEASAPDNEARALSDPAPDPGAASSRNAGC